MRGARVVVASLSMICSSACLGTGDFDAGHDGSRDESVDALQSGGCGNGKCTGHETCTNCPQDCGPCAPVCGDGSCQSGESCSSCPADCGPCPPVCGDGSCQSGESCSSCPADCG